MLNKRAGKMTGIETFLYECHLKEMQDEFLSQNMCDQIIVEETETDFEMICCHAEKLADK